MKGRTSEPDAYRLVLDFYPEGSRASGPGTTGIGGIRSGRVVRSGHSACGVHCSTTPTVTAASSTAQASPSAKQSINAPALAVAAASSETAAAGENQNAPTAPG